MADDESLLNQKVYLFGNDLTKIPCFRGSLLWGIGGGLSSGLVVFMFTSKVRLASHATVGTFSIVTLGYWIRCRHLWSHQKFGMGQIQGVIQETLTEDMEKRKKVEIVDV